MSMRAGMCMCVCVCVCVCLKERKRGLGVTSLRCLRLEAICSSEWSTMSPVTQQKLFSSHWLSRQQVSPCFPLELSINTSYPNTSSPYKLMVKLANSYVLN